MKTLLELSRRTSNDAVALQRPARGQRLDIGEQQRGVGRPAPEGNFSAWIRSFWPKRAALGSILALIVWWSFLTGHVT